MKLMKEIRSVILVKTIFSLKTDSVYQERLKTVKCIT